MAELVSMYVFSPFQHKIMLIEGQGSDGGWTIPLDLLTRTPEVEKLPQLYYGFISKAF